MKVEARLFALFGAFFLISGIVYFSLTREPTGGTALFVTAGMGGLVAYYLWFTGRRLSGPRPEDRPDATIEEGAGELGFFPPHSWWPIALAASAGMFVLGMVFGWWLSFVAAVIALWAIAGFVLEYYRGL